MGIVPYSRSNYLIVQKDLDEGSNAGKYTATYEGKGGLSKIFIGGSVTVPMDFVFGGTFEYYFGNLRYNSKIEFENDRAVYREPDYFGDSRYQGFTKFVGPYINVGPNEKYKISFISKVDEPGVYLVRFLSKMDSNSVRDSAKKDFGDNPWMNYSTGIDRIIYVN